MTAQESEGDLLPWVPVADQYCAFRLLRFHDVRLHDLRHKLRAGDGRSTLDVYAVQEDRYSFVGCRRDASMQGN